MAHADYIQRGSGLITPVATLVNNAGPGVTLLDIAGYTADTTDLPAVGGVAMVGSEIMKIVAISTTQVEVLRGCADTVPTILLSGSRMWFLEGKVGTDRREYLAVATIGVKLLMRTTGQQMEAKNSPPNAVVFNRRFVRPYPPGRVRIDGVPWHQHARYLDNLTPSFTVTWAHRDRVLQSDVFVGHEATSVGPEPGTTYMARVYKADNTLMRTVSGITGTSWDYDVSMASVDMGALAGAVLTASGYITLASVRDGLESFQHYRIDFTINTEDLSGWGYDFGNNFGG